MINKIEIWGETKRKIINIRRYNTVKIDIAANMAANSMLYTR